MNVEICIDCSSVRAAQASITAASKGGASRVELCSEMDVGGLSVDTRSILIARQVFGEKPGVMAMIRPRPGNFEYSPWEIREMSDAIEQAAISGADGVVFGVLKPSPNGPRIHLDAMSYLTRKARSLSLSITFHRAFDVLTTRAGSLELLIELGIDRVLTSGTAWDEGDADTDVGSGGWRMGQTELERLVDKADDRIEIIVAGGVSPRDGEVLRKTFRAPECVSVHAYSGVRSVTSGRTEEHLVRTLVEGVRKNGSPV